MKITEMYAYIDEADGLVAFHDSVHGWIPLVCASAATVPKLTPLAQIVANRSGRPVRLVRFTNRIDLEIVAPAAIPSSSG